MDYIVTIDQSAALFSDPNSDEAKFQNLCLNLLGGLELKDLSEEEKELLKKFGYEDF